MVFLEKLPRHFNELYINKCISYKKNTKSLFCFPSLAASKVEDHVVLIVSAIIRLKLNLL